MAHRRPSSYAARSSPLRSRGVRTLKAWARALLKGYFVAAVAFVVATSLFLLLDAPPAHAFYILWGSVTLIGASHGALGQGLAAGVLSSILLRSIYGDRVGVNPSDSGALAPALAFLVFAVWAARLNTVRAREIKAAGLRGRRG